MLVARGFMYSMKYQLQTKSCSPCARLSSRYSTMMTTTPEHCRRAGSSTKTTPEHNPALALDTSRILVGPSDRRLRVSEFAKSALVLRHVALGHAHPFNGVKVLWHRDHRWPSVIGVKVMQHVAWALH
jgi:hypothetical protein